MFEWAGATAGTKREGSTRAGKKVERGRTNATNKYNCMAHKFIIFMLDCATDYPKRGHKKRRRRRRKRPRRAGGSSGSVAHTHAGSSGLPSHTSAHGVTSASESNPAAHHSPPTSHNGAPGPSTTSGSTESTANLIDLNSPSMPEGNINGLMATLNINWIIITCLFVLLPHKISNCDYWILLFVGENSLNSFTYIFVCPCKREVTCTCTRIPRM